MGILRFLLALIVVIGHSQSLFGLNFIGGKVSVQAFYVISGFYMALILNEKYIGINGSYKLFITNRLIRLYPVYWAVLLIIIAASFFAYFVTEGETLGLLNIYVENLEKLHFSTLMIFIFTNIFILFQDTLLFFEVNATTGFLEFQPKYSSNNLTAFSFQFIQQSWTVGLEILFYLIAPFIVKRKNYIIIILILISFFIKYYTKNILGYNYAPWQFRFFPSELLYFLFGVLSYRLYKNKSFLMNTTIYFCSLTSLAILILFYDIIDFDVKEYVLFLSLFICIPYLFNSTKHIKLDRYIGELSYPIYICHIFIVYMMNKINFIPLPKTVSVIILSTIFSILLKTFVSDKIEVYRQRRIKT